MRYEAAEHFLSSREMNAWRLVSSSWSPALTKGLLGHCAWTSGKVLQVSSLRNPGLEPQAGFSSLLPADEAEILIIPGHPAAWPSQTPSRAIFSLGTRNSVQEKQRRGFVVFVSLWGNWGLGQCSDLPEAAQLGSGKANLSLNLLIPQNYQKMSIDQEASTVQRHLAFTFSLNVQIDPIK